MSKSIMGIDQETYDQQASAHSKTNIFIWLAAGLIYSYFTDRLISIPVLLLFVPGIFIASFASTATFYIEVKKRQLSSNVINAIILFILWLVKIFVPIVLAVIYINLLDKIL